MKRSQREETRKNNDFMRHLEDLAFNLGLEEEQPEAIEIKTYYETQKKVSAFDKRLKSLLKERNTKKTELGRIVGEMIGRDPISRQSIDAYTKGKVKPKVDVLIAMSQHFGVSCDYLLGFKDNPTITDQYISTSLGLTQESIDYLRSRKKDLDEKNKSEVDIMRELENKKDLKKDEKKKLALLQKKYSEGKIYTNYISDDILDIINLLIKDMLNMNEQLSVKRNGRLMKVFKGKNILHLLSKYLKPQGLNTLRAFRQESVLSLEKKINTARTYLDRSNGEQEKDELRKELQQIVDDYDKCSNDEDSIKLSEEVRLTVGMERIEKGLEALRIQLNQENSL